MNSHLEKIRQEIDRLEEPKEIKLEQIMKLKEEEPGVLEINLEDMLGGMKQRIIENHQYDIYEDSFDRLMHTVVDWLVSYVLNRCGVKVYELRFSKSGAVVEFGRYFKMKVNKIRRGLEVRVIRPG